MLIDDPVYSLLPWLLKGFTPPKTTEEESFNCYVNSGRIFVENAFGRLKSRWRCLCKRLDVKPTFIPSVVSTCCILHKAIETKCKKLKLHPYKIYVPSSTALSSTTLSSTTRSSTLMLSKLFPVCKTARVPKVSFKISSFWYSCRAAPLIIFCIQE